MAIGLRIPVGVNSSGGAALVEGDENDRKIIKSSLADDDNENAFQQNIGLGHSMIFDLSDPMLKSNITRKTVSIFEYFEKLKRFRLLTNTIKWEENSDKQELIFSFRYVNLESDQPKDFVRTFSSGE